MEDIQDGEGKGITLPIPWEERRKDIQKVARWVAQRLGIGEPEPLRARAYRLATPRLLARREVGKPADALRVGLYRAKVAALALLRLDEDRGWPDF
ncbi:hypothetical protein L6232_20645, partial [Shewanella sp. C31]|nr:hypothetical protein [Shewanella electrica]